MILEAVDSLKENASLGLIGYLSYGAFVECAACEKGCRILMFALAREIFRVRIANFLL